MTRVRSRRLVITGPGRLELTGVAIPEPGPDDLVVRPGAVGICGTDLELFDGSMAYLASGLAGYPIVPGHEWTGVVTGVGQRVVGFTVGDRVVGECSVGCGSCPRCMAGSYHLCPNRTETGIAGRPGALANTLVFPSTAAHRVPETVAATDAALIEPLAVAYRGVRRADVAAGETLTVVGAGPIGLLCALIARALGVTDVQLLEVDPARRQFAAELGFTVAQTHIEKAARVIEASGNARGVSTALETCLDGGVVVLLGLTGSGQVPVDLDDVVVRDLDVRGSLGSPGVWPEVIDLVADGQVRPSVLVSHEFPLDDVTAAFDLARRREPGVRKIIVHPNGSAHDA